MEVATLVADGAVSWISVTVEILDCPTCTQTLKHAHIPSLSICSLHLQYHTDRRIEWRSVYLRGTSGTKGSYFYALFLSSPCLFLCFLNPCISISYPPVLTIFLFGSLFSEFSQFPGVSSG